MDGKTDPERTMHGSPWAQIHGGYFSDPAVAQPLVAVVLKIQTTAQPDVIVDLGGGTGFLLAQIRAGDSRGKPALVDLDCSPAQLQVAREAGISTVCGAVDSFCRADVVPVSAQALFVMRSVLHYAGEAGLAPLLQQIHTQARPGEYWVHQTACFQTDGDAACLNSLYRQMRTGKWYPTTAGLKAQLNHAGWRVRKNIPAPVLPLDSNELARRYNLSHEEIRTMGRNLARDFGTMGPVFRATSPDHFIANLHYQIFVCQSAE